MTSSSICRHRSRHNRRLPPPSITPSWAVAKGIINEVRGINRVPYAGLKPEYGEPGACRRAGHLLTGDGRRCAPSCASYATSSHHLLP
jgi:hypothetical protein